MLDVYYPSLAALVAACREVRAYLRRSHMLEDSPESYNIRRVLPQFVEQVQFIDGTPQVVYVHPVWA